jgi:hypothetical protein
VKARIRLVLDYEVDAADVGLALDGAVLLADGDGVFHPMRSGAGCHAQRVGNAEVFSVEIADSTDPSETCRRGTRIVQGGTIEHAPPRFFEFSGVSCVGKIWRRCNAPGWGSDWHRFCEGPQNLPAAASRDEAAEQVCRATGIPFGPRIIAAMDELSKEMSDGH